MLNDASIKNMSNIKAREVREMLTKDGNRGIMKPEKEKRAGKLISKTQEKRSCRIYHHWSPSRLPAGSSGLSHTPSLLSHRMWWWWERKTSPPPATFSWMQRPATSSRRTLAPTPWSGSPSPKQPPSAWSWPSSGHSAAPLWSTASESTVWMTPKMPWR